LNSPIKLPRGRVAVLREFIVRADEKLSAFLELEAAIRAVANQTGSNPNKNYCFIKII
jgi:hypothetical protein